MTSAPAPLPWTRMQIAVVGAANVTGAALLVIGFALSSTTAGLDGQVGCLNLAVVGLTIGLGADAALFFTARRLVGRRRRRVIPDLVRAAAEAPDPQAGWVWLPGTARAHRSACPLIAGKATAPAPADLIRSRGLIRCEVCGC